MDIYLHIRHTKHPKYSFLSLTLSPHPILRWQSCLDTRQLEDSSGYTTPLFLGKIVGNWKRNSYFAAHLTLATDGCKLIQVITSQNGASNFITL